jgi:RNA polymerase sigma factor (sigma-70 family)
VSVHQSLPVELQIELCGPVLLRYCQKLTGSRWDAEDLVQDTFLKALPHLAHPHENPHAFLFRIAKNAWIDKCRKRRRANECLLVDEMLGEASTKTTGDAVESPAILDAMSRLLQALSPLQGAVLLLRDVFEFSNLEVANLIGTTEGAVKSSLHRARRNLENLENAQEKENLHAHKSLLNAYLEAFRNADAAGLVALAQNNVIHPVHALNTLRAFTRKQDAPQTQPAQMLLCA